MRIKWARSARADLLSIVRFIAKDDPAAARRMADRLRARVRRFSRFPRSGRIVPELETTGARELVEPPYRIIYIVLDDSREVRVLSVIHSKRLPGAPRAS